MNENEFKINLSNISLPKAIALVVEAWYDVQVLNDLRTEINQRDEALKNEAFNALDSAIAILNRYPRLKAAKISIERRGNKLGLRGYLPSKDDKNNFCIQRISLGLLADHEKLKIAELAANQVISEIETKSFSWSKWGVKNNIEIFVKNAQFSSNVLIKAIV